MINLISKLNIKQKIISLFMLFGFLPSVILFIIFNVNESFFQKTTSTMLARWADDVTELVDRNLFERYGDVQAFGLNSAVHDTKNWNNKSESNPLIKAMNGYATNYGLYQLMLVLDTKGEVQAVNTVDAKGQPIDTGSLYGKNFGSEDWFKNALEGKFLQGKNGMTGTYVAAAKKFEFIDNVYKTKDSFSIPFSAPIKDDKGKVIGVWVNFANFNLVEEIVKEFYPIIKEQDMASSEIILLDKDGNVLINYDPSVTKGEIKRDFNVIGKLNLAKSGVEAARLAVERTESGVVRFNNNNTGIEYVAGYAHSNGAYDFPGLGWSVVVKTTVKDAYPVMAHIEMIQLFAVLISVAITVLLGGFIGKRFSKPILDLADCATDLSKGNMIADIPHKIRKDEVGMMANALEIFKGYMIKAAQLAKKQVEEANAMRNDMQNKLNTLADNLEDEIEVGMSQVLSQSNNVMGIANHMTESSQLIIKKSQEMLETVTHNGNSITEIAGSAEEMLKSISDITKQVSKSDEITKTAVQISKDTTKTVSDLEEFARNVDSVVQLINDIAEQTNLLALNATIEAARAGEAGKGFAVVASEVKNLADQTTKATDSVSEQIKKIQGITVNAVSDISKIASTIEEINNISTHISTAIQEQDKSTLGITKRTEETANGIKGIIEVINHLNGEFASIKDTAENLKTNFNSIVTETQAMQGRMQNIIASNKDRRLNKRFFPKGYKIAFKNGMDSVEAEVYNISRDGAAISLVPELSKFDKGSKLELTIPDIGLVWSTVEGKNDKSVRLKFQMPQGEIPKMDQYLSEKFN